MNLNEKTWDDLTKITGIGENRQEWLRQSFNIRTFNDLAKLTATQIQEKTKRDGLIVSLKAIKDWLDQANELASRVDDKEKLPEPAADLPEGVSNTMPREDGWKPIASFVVEYQTREAGQQLTELRTVAHYMEDDRTQTWPGIEGNQLCDWIIDQIPGEFSRYQEKQNLLQKQSSGEGQDQTSTAVKITHLRIRQPANSASPIQSVDPTTQFQTSVLCEQPFSFEVDFELIGPKAKEVADRKISWRAETRTFDPVSRTSPQLCESGPKSFEKGRLKYMLHLPEISLKQGIYHVWALIIPERPSMALPDFLDIPNFLVV